VRREAPCNVIHAEGMLSYAPHRHNPDARIGHEDLAGAKEVLEHQVFLGHGQTESGAFAKHDTPHHAFDSRAVDEWRAQHARPHNEHIAHRPRYEAVIRAEQQRIEALQASLFAPGNDPSSWLDGWHAIAIAAQSAALRATPESQWHDAGAARVLVVQGLDDVLAPPVNGRELVARLGARAALIEIANAGHAMLPEQPRLIADALGDFFGSH